MNNVIGERNDKHSSSFFCFRYYPIGSFDTHAHAFGIITRYVWCHDRYLPASRALNYRHINYDQRRRWRAYEISSNVAFYGESRSKTKTK